MTGHEQQRGVVELRLSGNQKDIDAVAGMLAGRVEVLSESGPRVNRRDPGVRVYLTVRIDGDAA